MTEHLDPTTASDAALYVQYATLADGTGAHVKFANDEGNEEPLSDPLFANDLDSYTASLGAAIYTRAYDAAFSVANASPRFFTKADAEEAALLVAAEMLDLNKVWQKASKTMSGVGIAAQAGTRVKNNVIRDRVYVGTLASAKGSTEKVGAEARRFYVADPHSYAYETGRALTLADYAHDLELLEEKLDSEAFSMETETEAIVRAFRTVTYEYLEPKQAIAYLHTTGISPEVTAYLDKKAAEALQREPLAPNSEMVAIREEIAVAEARHLKAARLAAAVSSRYAGLRRAAALADPSPFRERTAAEKLYASRERATNALVARLAESIRLLHLRFETVASVAERASRVATDAAAEASALAGNVEDGSDAHRQAKSRGTDGVRTFAQKNVAEVMDIGYSTVKKLVGEAKLVMFTDFALLNYLRTGFGCDRVAPVNWDTLAFGLHKLVMTHSYVCGGTVTPEYVAGLDDSWFVDRAVEYGASRDDLTFAVIDGLRDAVTRQVETDLAREAAKAERLAAESQVAA